jgi:hypothetical protein
MKQTFQSVARAVSRPASMVLLFIALSGCTVKLISSYDEETDTSVMALQRKVETFLVKLEALDGFPECTYDHHKAFYAGAKVDISAIHVRAAAVPQNEMTVDQVGLLSKSLDSLEQLHKGKLKRGRSCFSKEEIEPVRRSFNASFIAILKLELAKKRGGRS